MALSLLTKDRHGYSVAFSPYYGDKLAVATSQHFGIAGKIFVVFLKQQITFRSTKFNFLCGTGKSRMSVDLVI